jgi:hypothetical protein
MPQPIWNTAPGSLGTYPAAATMHITLSASPVPPATTITYIKLSGTLPAGVEISNSGIISGIPKPVTSDVQYSFTVRATDNLGNIRDRTFLISIAGSLSPSFVTPTGIILTMLDSTWVDLPIEYTNPSIIDGIRIALSEGSLPPGLEINDSGVIRGYAKPPIVNVSATEATVLVTETQSTNNYIVCNSTNNFVLGRPIVFTGDVFGGVNEGMIYYVKTVVDATKFTVSFNVNGPDVPFTDGYGSMQGTLPATTIGQPTIKTYEFTLDLISDLGNDRETYQITIVNQNTPVSQGGPGNIPNTRIPSILNTRPLAYQLDDTDPYYGYYILPPVNPTTNAIIGTVQSDDYFSFKIIGHDFDDSTLIYNFSGLPLGLSGNSNTGWITGTPLLTTTGITNYAFTVNAYKASNPSINTGNFNFMFTLSNDVSGKITWITNSDLGTVFNGSISTMQVQAFSDVPLNYRLVGGALPPNLELTSNGEIIGRIADQPADKLVAAGDSTDFTFAIEAYATDYSIVFSARTFTVKVLQEFSQPTDTLYIKCAPDIDDRLIIRQLLDNQSIFPADYLYRPDDQYFGMAKDVIYEHAYGINASDIDEYLSAVTRNHYWRQLTLGQIKTAIAKDSKGVPLYEVVYSEVIDNLIAPTISTVNSGSFLVGKTYVIKYPGNTDWTSVGAANNSQGTMFIATRAGTGTGSASTVVNTTSVNNEITWPREIDLGLGPWYTSITDIYTSYVFGLDSLIGNKEFYTSRTPGYAKNLYPNSLPNMRTRIDTILGAEYDSRLLPAWMTSQQANGSSLGYTPAWVMCYCLPRIVVDGVAMTYEEFETTGLARENYKSYAETISSNIATQWPHTLNQINFEIDRFSVDKSATYNYDKKFTLPTWVALPSGKPVPNPLDSKDFYVLFPRKTILPNESQQ